MEVTFNSENTLKYFEEIVRYDGSLLEGIKVAAARVKDMPVIIPENKYNELVEMGILEQKFQYYVLTEVAYNWFKKKFQYEEEVLKDVLREFQETFPDIYEKFKRYLLRAKIEFDYNDLWLLDLNDLIVTLKNGNFSLNEHMVRIILQQELQNSNSIEG